MFLITKMHFGVRHSGTISGYCRNASFHLRKTSCYFRKFSGHLRKASGGFQDASAGPRLPLVILCMSSDIISAHGCQFYSQLYHMDNHP